MTWVRIDDGMPSHPKLARVGPLGLALQVAALCYCNRHLTDGHLPWGAVRTLVCWEYLDTEGSVLRVATLGAGRTHEVTTDHVVGLLVEAGIWTEEPGGYRIHGYADFQPTRAAVLSEREALAAKRSAAGSKGAANRWQTDGKPDGKPMRSRSQTHGPDPDPDPDPDPRSDPPVVPPEVQKPRRGRAPRSLLPDGWEPSSETIAVAKGLGILEWEIPGLTAEFRDYWRGRGDLQADWEATYRNHLRRTAQRRGLRPAPAQLPLGARKAPKPVADREAFDAETRRLAAADRERLLALAPKAGGT